MNTLWQTIKPFSKNQASISIEGTGLTVPVTAISGSDKGPSVLITTGVHGSEYPGTLAMIELAGQLRPEDVCGRLIIIHPVNTQAFKARVANIIPEDGQNLNRMFPGDPEGSVSSRVAWWLTGLSDGADFYLDLHSGDLFEELTPYVYFPGNASEDVIAQSLAVAKVLDVPYMVRSTAKTGAYNSAALRGTPSLLLERGCAGYCRRSEVDLYIKDVKNVLKHLRLLSGEKEPNQYQPKEMSKVIYLESEHDALWQSLVNPGDEVKKGQPLGRIFDFFGRTLQEYEAEMDGLVLYQLYPLSTNKGDVLIAYGS